MASAAAALPPPAAKQVAKLVAKQKNITAVAAAATAPPTKASTACATCYRAKAKCLMGATGTCTRCEQNGIQCVGRIPKTRGRKPVSVKKKSSSKKRKSRATAGAAGGVVLDTLARVGFACLPSDHFGLRAMMRYMVPVAARQENAVAAVAKVFAIASHLGIELAEVRKMAMALSKSPVLRNVEWDRVGSAMVRERHNHAVQHVLTRSAIPCGPIASRFIMAMHWNDNKEVKFFHSAGCNELAPFANMSGDAWTNMLSFAGLNVTPKTRTMMPPSQNKVTLALAHLIKAYTEPVGKKSLSKSVLVNDVHFIACQKTTFQCVVTCFFFNITSGVYIIEFIKCKPATKKKKRPKKLNKSTQEGTSSSSSSSSPAAAALSAAAAAAAASPTRTAALEGNSSATSSSKGGLHMLLEMLA
jgi:hypothetical protein